MKRTKSNVTQTKESRKRKYHNNCNLENGIGQMQKRSKQRKDCMKQISMRELEVEESYHDSVIVNADI